MELLVGHNADVNARDVDGQTSLHVVTANNSINSFHCLLPFIEDINVTDAAGRTGLHHAAYNGHAEVCSLRH